MASPSPTEIARQAIDEVRELKAKVAQLESELNRYQLLVVLQRMSVLETKVTQSEVTLEEVKKLAVIDDRVCRLERERDESGKRSANFIYAVIGIALGVVGNLIVSAFKKS